MKNRGRWLWREIIFINPAEMTKLKLFIRSRILFHGFIYRGMCPATMSFHYHLWGYRLDQEEEQQQQLYTKYPVNQSRRDGRENKTHQHVY